MQTSASSASTPQAVGSAARVVVVGGAGGMCGDASLVTLIRRCFPSASDDAFSHTSSVMSWPLSARARLTVGGGGDVNRKSRTPLLEGVEKEKSEKS